MHNLLSSTLAWVAALQVPAPAPVLRSSAAPQLAQALEFRNGRWFDGHGFVERTLFAVDGVFVRERPASIERSLDLGGGYVVPPFGEAHNHNVHDGADGALQKYLQQGVFYVANPNSLARTTTTIRAQVNRGDGIDVLFAGGGLTASGGHPVDVVEPMLQRGIWSAADGEGGFYFAIDDAADLDATWPAIRAQPRDFLKTYLLYSEEYERRRADEATRGWRGLDPALLPEIVQRAHAAGWRVATHIESAADFRNALAAGVDEINHMPGFRPLVPLVDRVLGVQPVHEFELASYALTEADARRAAEQDTVVVTTLGALLRTLEPFDDTRPEFADAQRVLRLVRANLELLRRAHVRLVLGSDEYDYQESTVVDEFLALSHLDLFEPEELLRMWCVDTPRAIFPQRRLGGFEPGDEASLLVLGADPLAEPEGVRDVRLRVKQGRVLELAR